MLFNRLFFWFFGFFSAFLPLVSLAYLSYLSFLKVKLKIVDWFFIILFFSILLMKLISYQSNIALPILTFNAYFGFLAFYAFFKVTGLHKELSLKYLFYCLCLVILLEVVLVNTIVSAIWLPNYPDTEGVVGQTHISAGYQRPYSVGGNTTVTSTILLAVASMARLKIKDYCLLIFTVLILKSATGMLLFFVFCFGKFFLSIERKWSIILIPGFLFLLSLFIYFIYDIIDLFNFRLNSDYIKILIDLKINQIGHYFSGYSPFEYIFGKISNLDSNNNGYGYKGDFGWLEVALGYGFLSCLAIISFIFTKVNMSNFLAISIMLIGTLHYGVIHTVVGQVFLALFMSTKNSND